MTKGEKVLLVILDILGVIAVGILMCFLTLPIIEKNIREEIKKEYEIQKELLRELDTVAKENTANIENDILSFISENNFFAIYEDDALLQKTDYIDERIRNGKEELSKAIIEVHEKYKKEYNFDMGADYKRIEEQATQILEIKKTIFYFQTFVFEAIDNNKVKYLELARQVMLQSGIDVDRDILNKYLDVCEKSIKESIKNGELSDKQLDELVQIEDKFYKEIEESISGEKGIKLLKDRGIVE